MHKGQERRRYKRIEKLYKARVRVKQHGDHESGPTDWDLVAVKDLGAAGLFFYYKKDLQIGSLLDLQIDVSAATPTINCVGKIKRIEEPIPPSIFGIATEFTGIEEQQKEMINTTVEEILE
jgi:hypothetical protein